MPAGDQPVDDAGGVVGGDDALGPPAASRTTRPRPSTADSRARVTVVPTATTRPPRALVAFTASAVTAGTRKRSACGASPASCEDSPVCRVMGVTPTPLLISRVDEVGGERSRRRRHLGAAGVDAEDGLVVGERVAAVEVPVGDRPSGPGHGRGEVAGRGRPPEAVADARGGGVLPRVRRGEGERGAVEHDGLARRRRRGSLGPRRGRCGARRRTRRRRGGWRRARRRSPRVVLEASASAATVALVFTTTRSPGASSSGRSRKTRCRRSPGARATRRRTPSRGTPRCSAGAAAKRHGGHAETPVRVAMSAAT